MILIRNLWQRVIVEFRLRELSTWEATRRIVQMDVYRSQQLRRRFERRLAEQEPPKAA